MTDLENLRYVEITLQSGDTITLTLDGHRIDRDSGTLYIESKYRVTAKSAWTLEA